MDERIEYVLFCAGLFGWRGWQEDWVQAARRCRQRCVPSLRGALTDADFFAMGAEDLIQERVRVRA